MSNFRCPGSRSRGFSRYFWITWTCPWLSMYSSSWLASWDIRIPAPFVQCNTKTIQAAGQIRRRKLWKSRWTLDKFTFSSSWWLGYPHCALSAFFFRVIRGQEDFSLICFRIALQMAKAVRRWSNRGVEISGIDDVGFREPVTGIRQLRAGLY